MSLMTSIATLPQATTRMTSGPNRFLKLKIIDLNIAWLETKHDDITINFPILNPHPVVNDNSSNMIYNPESRELARPHSAAEVRANKKSNDMTVHSG